MSQSSLRTNPLIVIAATAVILTCLIAIGMMTGIIPTPSAREQALVENTQPPPPPGRTALNDSRPSARASAPAPAPVARARTPERPPQGRVSDDTPSRSVGGSGPSRNMAAVCNNCGTVTSVRTVTRQGEAGLVGPIAGGALGGLVGSQIGGGSGKTIATIAGAAGGAAIGTEVERRQKATTSYVVGVRLNNGTTQSFTFESAPGYQQGDRVKVVEGRLVRDS
jgi:outer membrane lipoprotein SlyB